MFKTGICCVLFVLIGCAYRQAEAQEAFKLLPPSELAVQTQSEPEQKVFRASEGEMQVPKKVPDIQVYSWPLYYKTRDIADVAAYIEARCSAHPTHAKDAYMSGFLSGLYAKKKRQIEKLMKEKRFAACVQDFTQAKSKVKFYTLMMKNTFPLSELSEKNVSDLEGYYYATDNKKIYKKLEQLSQTDLPTAPAAAKVLRTIERADAYEGQ